MSTEDRPTPADRSAGSSSDAALPGSDLEVLAPVLAVVGRPNVGKSTLVNRIIGRREAVVEDKPGVTRDRIYGDAEWLQYAFTLIDTGGIEPDNPDQIAVQMRRQAELAKERLLAREHSRETPQHELRRKDHDLDL